VFLQGFFPARTGAPASVFHITCNRDEALHAYKTSRRNERAECGKLTAATPTTTSIGDKLVAHCRGCAHKKHFCMYIIVSNATKHQNCDEYFTDRLLSPPKTKNTPAIPNTWHRPFIGRRPASVRAYTNATFRARYRGEASKIFTFLASLENRH
jgi:hypothetical protein